MSLTVCSHAQVYNLISSLRTIRLHMLPPGYWTCSFVLNFNSTESIVYSPAAIPAHWTYRTHCDLCPTRYWFSWNHLRENVIEIMSQSWQNMIFLWKSRFGSRTPDSVNCKAPLSDHYATSSLISHCVSVFSVSRRKKYMWRIRENQLA